MLPTYYLNIFHFGLYFDFTKVFLEIPLFLVGLLLFLWKYKEDNEMSFYAFLFFVLYFIPMNSVLCLNDVTYEYFLMVNLYSYLIIVGLQWSTNSVSYRHLRNAFSIAKWNVIIRIFLFFVCAIAFIYTYLMNGFKFSSLLSMYEVRAEFSEYSAGIVGSSASYFIMIASKICGYFLPILTYLALQKKMYFELVLSILAQIAVFTINMGKNSLMILLVVFVLYYLINNKKSNPKLITRSLQLFSVLFSFAFLERVFFNTDLIFYVFIRRVFYIPAWLNNVYYDFFSNNPKLFFFQDCFIIQNFCERVYPVDAIRLISQKVFMGLLPSPNTGMFAEAYMQIGYAGTIVFPIVIVLVVKIVSWAASVYGNGASKVIAFKVMLSLISMPILESTTMIGLVVFVVISLIIMNTCNTSDITNESCRN